MNETVAHNAAAVGAKALLRQYARDGDAPALSDSMNPLERYFWSHSGAVIHKWLHYFDIYHRYFDRFRGTPVRMLEIGVAKGGSLEMWRDYLGPEATIFGIDIDPACAQFDGKAAHVRIGSQDDPEFLASVIDAMGGVDIVLDDGSHHSKHIRASLDALYPRLTDGGVYMIEDLHCAYWPGWGGGYRKPKSFMTDVKRLIDDMHHWYHGQGETNGTTAGHLAGLHIYDSIVVLEKQRVAQPSHSRQGGGALWALGAKAAGAAARLKDQVR